MWLRLFLLCSVILVAGCGVAPDEEHEAPPPETTTTELSSIDCGEHTDTGYKSGSAFTITVVTVDGKPVERDTANAYYVMAQAASAAGVNIAIVSGFRTMSEQQYLYGCYINCSCNSCNVAAKPGYSNHQSGHALDLNTSAGGVYNWLAAHGAAYGFSRTVPSEAWHWEWWGGGPGGGPCASCVAEKCNGKDDDCDGLIDEDVSQLCGTDVGECELGTQVCENGSWGECVGGITPKLESCDELDNDCDGTADEAEVCELEESWQASLYDAGVSSDVNGDGNADGCALSGEGIECRFSKGTGFESALAQPLDGVDVTNSSIFSTLRTGDITGDGRADVCLRTSSGVSCWIGTGHGLGKHIVGPPLTDAAGWNEARYFSAIRLADIDGDKKVDLCARAADGLHCYPSTGKGFGPALILSALSDASGFDDVNRFGTLRLGDVNGDGASDVCARSSDGMSCWLSRGKSGFGERIVGPAWTDAAGFGDWHRWSTIRLADVDGDGSSDLCARDGEAFHCYLFDGAGFGKEVLGPSLPDSEDWGRRDRIGSLRVGDINGDGAADVCARGAEGVSCWLFGEGSFDKKLQGPALSDADGWTKPDRYRTLRLADIDGDRRADLCARTDLGVRCWLFQSGGFAKAISGPNWSDSEGWSAPERYHTIRFAGIGVKATLPESDGDEDASSDSNEATGCGCRLGRGTNSGSAAWLFVLVVLRRLRRRSSSSSQARCVR